MANDSMAAYGGWDEAVVSNEKGRREIHYYLKRRGGGRDLVVVGKEKSARHMSYRYAVKGKELLLSFFNRSSWLKLRSRREVIDWLNSFVSDEPDVGSLEQFDSGLNGKLGCNVKVANHRNHFSWIGSSWTCRKRRMHYQSFSRNGAVISAHDFVYVLAEENKRLVAYLDDMYEDTRGNKMVVVRWFHRLDEVGFILPHNYNDREIFFSLCLQDLSIECIDGLATVLSPEHYENYFDEALGMGVMPFVCCRQFDNDDLQPFDITRVNGYWNQKILRENSLAASKLPEDHHRGPKRSHGDANGSRPSKRIRWSNECDTYVKSPNGTSGVSSLESEEAAKMGILKPVRLHESSPRLDIAPPKSVQFLSVGSDIEVLSQDSGIRGCWFRASIIKKHKDKVKVQYHDLMDALDDSKRLEEWILASRIAVTDSVGIRISGRTMTRPTPLNGKGCVFGLINVGCVVDAWWNDGWWEGIVVSIEAEDRMKVYFSGEKLELVFSTCDMRHSREWFNNEWHGFKEMTDVVSSIYRAERISEPEKSCVGVGNRNLATPNRKDGMSLKVNKTVHCMMGSEKHQNATEALRDLLKDSSFAQLQWKTSGKRWRRSSRSPIHKVHFGTTNNDDTGLQSFQKFLAHSSLKFDQDNCKYASDSHFTSQVVPPLTNLVMSR